MEMDKRKIVRANGAGVFFGEIIKQDGTTVTMRNVRRLWHWDGGGQPFRVGAERDGSPREL